MSRFAAEKEAGHNMPSFAQYDGEKPPPSHFVELGKEGLQS
jgi:hypothetical protein